MGGKRNFGCYLVAAALGLVVCLLQPVAAGEAWLQFKFDARHSGDVPDRSVSLPLGLVGAVPLTDAIFTAPVVADGHVYVVDGSGVAFCIDAKQLRVIWKYQTRGGPTNCNNVSSPAVVGRYLHFGTMAGSYYVLDRSSGKVVREIRCGEPILTAPVVGDGRVYFVTLGVRAYAIEPDGRLLWTWDFVREELGFKGDRWNGADWVKHKGKRVDASDQFCCSRDIALAGKTLIIPAGRLVLWLEDIGPAARLRAKYCWAKRDTPRVTTFGLSVGRDGAVFRQVHHLDNIGEVEVLRVRDGQVQVSSVPGTETASRLPGSLSVSSVSLRGNAVYRCRPEEGFGLCRHELADDDEGGSDPSQSRVQPLGGYPSISSPILLRNSAVYGALDGRLYVVSLDGAGKPWSFTTAFGKAITAPVAVADGQIYFGCEDGYLYVLGPNGNAPLPTKGLGVDKIRSPLRTRYTDAKYDWFTSFGNWNNANVAADQGLRPPFCIKWMRRYAGTVKHFSSCGGGRLYTHTAEGQIIAVEQETGRLLWRRYFPGVHISYTSPLYYKGRLLVPQAGLRQCWLRCLDAATGRLIWQAPFSGSPSWNRQQPPIVHDRLVFYAFSTGKYAPDRDGQRMQWLFGHGERGFPENQRPMVRAYDLQTGRVVWTVDFSKYGYGGDDGGLCLLDGTLYYSCYLGLSARRAKAGSPGVTAAIEPRSGRVLWATDKYAVCSGCTISGEAGRLYLGGYASAPGGRTRHVRCLDARDGSLIWQSDPISQAIHVVTIGPKFLLAWGQQQDIYVIDKATGKVIKSLTKFYRCTRHTFCPPYLLGVNTDVLDVTTGKLLWSGPSVEPNACVGTILSNGRLFYTSQGGGLQLSLVYGQEATEHPKPWQQDTAR
ncbi:MAG: PQQ-binding-like beta-propeller repeat protein [Planctomycetes bacterium]|nr:PQQ-binding-like beta-propeller repeat protein [Planctomycetota bacterium]